MDDRPLLDHLSVSAIQLYRHFPLAWKRRYLDGVGEPPTPALAFGTAFALALEAHHHGQDGETVFVRVHAATRTVLPGAASGLRVLGLYRQHVSLDGRPEQPFSRFLPDRRRVPVPNHGVMDLERSDEVVAVPPMVFVARACGSLPSSGELPTSLRSTEATSTARVARDEPRYCAASTP